MSEDSRAQAPDPRTGQDGQHQTDEDGMQQQTDEDRLLLLQETENDTVDDLHSRAMIRWVSQQRKLGQLEFKYQNLVEKKRLARALSIFEEEHGVLYSEPCLLCLENIYVGADDSLATVFICCGGFICKTCALDIDESGNGLDNCPLCRASTAEQTEAEDSAQLMALAERGVLWAQRDLGRCMIEGMDGFKKQETTGLEWLNKAAAQQYPRAIYYLSTLYRTGLTSVLRKSEEKANELLLKSANLGCAPANSVLAGSYFRGCRGFEKDPVEAYFRASVAHAINDSGGKAAILLGLYHHATSDRPECSPYLACYYLNIAANEDSDGKACFLYSQALKTLSKHLHDGNVALPGSNVIPALFFWARKSHDLECIDARNWLKTMESIGQSQCANCGKEAQGATKFKQCSKCKAQWYCSKECQVEAWRAGHKKDCKRASILKFEDYLNAE